MSEKNSLNRSYGLENWVGLSFDDTIPQLKILKINIMTMVKVHNPVLKNLNSFFYDEFFNELPAFGKASNNLYSPAVNIIETADAYHLELNAPGRNKEDFKLTVDKGLLTISYEKKEETKNEDAKVVRKEFSYQSFKRSFSIDEKINSEAIEAKYENGLLKLLLPKLAEVKQPVKNISIQ